jgi:hypothetical protein
MRIWTDSGGNLVAFQRMGGAMLASIQIAEHKARAAAAFRRETKVFENGIQLMHSQLFARVRRNHCVSGRHSADRGGQDYRRDRLFGRNRFARWSGQRGRLSRISSVRGTVSDWKIFGFILRIDSTLCPDQRPRIISGDTLRRWRRTLFRRLV